METIRKKALEHETNEIESIKARIADLDEYEIGLDKLYNELKLAFGEKNKSTMRKANRP